VTRLVAVAAVGILMLAACQRDEQAPVTPASEPSPQVVNPGTLGGPGRVPAGRDRGGHDLGAGRPMPRGSP